MVDWEKIFSYLLRLKAQKPSECIEILYNSDLTDEELVRALILLKAMTPFIGVSDREIPKGDRHIELHHDKKKIGEAIGADAEKYKKMAEEVAQSVDPIDYIVSKLRESPREAIALAYAVGAGILKDGGFHALLMFLRMKEVVDTIVLSLGRGM